MVVELLYNIVAIYSENNVLAALHAHYLRYAKDVLILSAQSV